MSLGNWYLTRDSGKRGALVAHKEVPTKGCDMWGATEGEIVIQANSTKRLLFPFELIAWELDEPIYVENFDPDDYRGGRAIA